MNPTLTRIALLIIAVACGSSVASAQDYLTGSYRLTRQTTAIVEPELAEALEKTIGRSEQLQWQVYVPESYDPHEPAGLFVYLDPNGTAYIPDDWQQVFAAQNVIWVGVRPSQRRMSELRWVWQGILGSRAIAKDYAIDLQRMYVGGLFDTVSAAFNTMLIANEFSGAVYMRKSFYSAELDADQLETIQRKYHVFITGTNDEGKNRIQLDYDKYRRNGIVNSKLVFEMQRMGNLPSAGQMGEALEFLDSHAR